METLLKLVAGGAIFWLLFAGGGILKNRQASAPAGSDSAAVAVADTMEVSRHPAVQIQSLDFLQDHSKYLLVINPVTVTYHRSPGANQVTAAGSVALPWQTLSVNPFDFPLSVPEAERRGRLAAVMAAERKRTPEPRVFIVLEFGDGKRYLTEASDTASALPSRTVSWYIGEAASDPAFSQTPGEQARAYCFIIDDPAVTFARVEAQSNQ
ncbi:MAG: hypothetical protein ONB48_17215 [candidate division KSB1 bacterium]|nr:hypothetical protein [candidate division KSB1 bacterium]MDZ7275218.1 hypothetical protein [candidate division KSB1 bacterium]MDZ7287387.1 hypothetical protein [candidate division KSB1 bacterium]MDZ7299501.1 hypothetical protein [candidate division KSB1 bacterium]MDZ7305453.1 hypothetical protein [candidate division KSB1 bacterium]